MEAQEINPGRGFWSDPSPSLPANVWAAFWWRNGSTAAAGDLDSAPLCIAFDVSGSSAEKTCQMQTQTDIMPCSDTR